MKILDIQKDKIDIELIISPNTSRNRDVETSVSEILNHVREYGDKALFELTARFDKVRINPGDLKVVPKEIKEAYKKIDKKFLATAKTAIKNITEYHKHQFRETKMYRRTDGTILSQRIRPFKRVGMYVPGGAAPLASSLLMCAIPAKVAGVPEMVLTTPPDSMGKINPYILVCADLAGIQEMYKVGGAQAIGALAYGTQTISKVDKIVGPGNSYVVEAKKQVFGLVDIDLLPGPSEILVIADDTAKPAWIAADLLSQAEHTGNERVFLFTPSKTLAAKVVEELSSQVNRLSRRQQAGNSLQSGGAVILTRNLDECIELANRIAPEHLEIHTKNPRKVADKVTSVGAIFIGPWTPEPIGDYIAGTNHILPTGGTARMFSGLNVDEFIKKTNIVEYTEKGFKKIANAAIHFAEIEHLGAHAESVRIRLKK